MRFSLRRLMFIVFISAGLAWSLHLGITRARINIEASRSSYAARLVADMCVAHMQANGQVWPGGWAELEDDFEPCLARSGQSWSFEDLQGRVSVDWKIDPQQFLSKTESKSVIWITRHPNRKWYGMSPNEIISKYLASTGPATAQ